MPASDFGIKDRQFSPSSLNTVIDAQNTTILCGSAIFYVQAEQPISLYREKKLQSTTMEEEQHLNLTPTLCNGLTSLSLSAATATACSNALHCAAYFFSW